MVSWGILGAGNIAHRFAKSLAKEPNSVLTAIAARNEEKALAFGKQFPFKRYYLDYEELLNDSEIDVIYLALPHGLHKEWAVRALRKGKAVLCEKPAALSETEVQEIAEAAEENNTLFMEAMKPRFVPIAAEVRQLVSTGVIGQIEHVETTMCGQFSEQKHKETYHTQPGQGGALLDCGTYCASWIEQLIPGDIYLTKVYVSIRNKVDYYVDASLKSDQGVTARLEVAFDRVKPKKVTIVGTSGTIEVQQLHRSEKILVKTATGSFQLEKPYVVDDFYGEISHFVKLVMQKKKQSNIMTLSASIRCAKILDVIRAGFEKYDENDLRILEKQEELLEYEEFNSEKAMELGNCIVQMAGQYDREISVQITREEDETVIFQYLMDSKTDKNLQYMAGKRKASLISHHASLYPSVEFRITDKLPEALREENCFCVGGAVPVRVGKKRVATVAVSGLHEGKDHELIVHAMSRQLGVKIPEFCKALF